MQRKLDCMKIACNIIVVQTRNTEGERRCGRKNISPRAGKRQLAILMTWKPRAYTDGGGGKGACATPGAVVDVKPRALYTFGARATAHRNFFNIIVDPPNG